MIVIKSVQLLHLLHFATCYACSSCYTCHACYTCCNSYAFFVWQTCYPCQVCKVCLLHLLPTLATLITLATLSTLATRVTLVTFATLEGATIHLLRLLQYVCYTSRPCYVGYACYIQQVVSIDNPIRNFLHCLMRNLIYFFILSKLTIQFNFPFCAKTVTKISISQLGHRVPEVYDICRPVFNNLTQEGILSLSALQLSSTSLL